MKGENQVAILKMVERDFHDNNYSSIIFTDGDGTRRIKIVRDFITVTELIYDAKDILRLSIENNGDVFGAILNEFKEASRKQREERYKNLLG